MNGLNADQSHVPTVLLFVPGVSFNQVKINKITN